MEIQAVVFDLDGVLIDSREAWYHIHKTIFHDKGFKMPDKEEWMKNFWGMDIITVCGNFGFSKEETERTIKTKDMLLLDNIGKITIFDGVISALKKLKEKHIKIGVVSNNKREFVEKVVRKFNIESFFDLVIGDEYGPKPKPDGLLKMLGIFGAEKSEAIFVGDTETDKLTGKAAGVKTLIIGKDIENIEWILNFL